MFEDSMADARFLAGKRGQMREKGQKPMPKASKPKINSELEDLLMEQDEEDVFGGDIEQGELLEPDENDEIGTSMGDWDSSTKREFIEYRNAYYTAKFGRRLTPELQVALENYVF